MSSHLKIKDLRASAKDELLKKLEECKKELSQLRVTQQANGNDARVGRIRPLRKNIARILTVLNQNERLNLKKFYNTKQLRSKTPKALRPKLTHRRRLALTPKEQNRKTHHQIVMAARFPKRVFAVKI